VTIRIDAHGNTVSLDHLPDQKEIALGIFLAAEDRAAKIFPAASSMAAKRAMGSARSSNQ